MVDNKEIVPQEKCIVDEEYDLIKKCCESAFQQRPKLSEINKRLKEVLHHVGMYHPGIINVMTTTDVIIFPETSLSQIGKEGS